MRLFATLLCATAGLLLAGCAQLTREGRADLSGFRHVFVEQRLNDNLGVDRMLVGELTALGYEAQSGPLTMMPENTQLIVTYDVRETWDFRPYVIELNAAVRPAKDYNRIIGAARYFRPGVTNKPASAMVHELATKLFPAAKR
ncbi:MAG: hypothetical protein C0518_14840 [Opitutus sp.]|nr:hypothetical protein [Opitutus sp.]